MKVPSWIGAAMLATTVLGAPGQTTQNAETAQTAQTATISGRVLKYGTREPLGDITVELIREGGAPTQGPAAGPGPAQQSALQAAQQASSRIATTTQPDGSFLLRATPGEYRLYGSTLNGYLPAEYGQRSPTGIGLPVTLKAGPELAGANLTMTPTASISGRVTDAAGDPVVFANVIAGRVVYRQGVRALEAAQSSMTNDRGEYRIFWLAPGTYVLDAIPLAMRQYTMPATPPARFGGREHISDPLVALRPSPDGGAPIEVVYMPAFFPGVADVRSTQRITVHPGDSIHADINAAPSEVPSLHVRGAVMGTDGRPANGVRVTLIPRFVEGHSVQPPAGSANPNGVFEVIGVVPGSYLLFAGTTVIPIEVGDKGVDNLHVQLIPPVTIPWHVDLLDAPRTAEVSKATVRVSLARDPQLAGAPGTPPAGALAAPTAAGNRGGAAATQTALQNVGSGDYRVTVTDLPPNSYVKAIHLGGEDVLRDGLHVYGPTGNTLEITLSGAAGTIDGIVVDEGRRPFANATIALVPPPGQRQTRIDLYRTTASGSDGRFRIAGLPPGEYKLFAWEDVQSGEWFNPEFIQKEEIRGTPVRVSEGATESLALQAIPLGAAQ